MGAEHEGETSTMDVSEARNQGERCGGISTMDCTTSNKPILFPCARMEFNVIEHPVELELESEQDVEINEACEEGETTDDDEECTFLFQGEMNPMPFVEEDNASELQPYQRLEQIQNDYEILAAKKRSALDREICEIPVKRFRQEEFLGASFEEIMETINFGMKKKSTKPKQRGRRKGSKNKVNPEVTQKLGDATLHYAHGRFEEAFFSTLQPKNASAHPQLIIDVADSLMTVDQYESALKYYMMLEGDGNNYNGYLHLKIARCCVSLKKRAQAVEYYYEAIQKLNDSVDARLTLSSLLLEERREDEAISVLSPPIESESTLDPNSDVSKSWWHNGRIKLKLSQIYKAKGSCEAFVDVISPVIRETLFLESVRRKVKPRKRLSRSALSQRVKVLDDHETGGVFHGFRPVASSADLSKATRAKKLLKKKDAIKKAKRAAALATGLDWQSDDSDEESPQVFPEPPLPDLLKDEGHHHLILDLCKSLSSLQRYWDALEIVNLCLRTECNTFSVWMKEELRTLGARIAYNLADPANGWDCVRYLVSQHPYSFAAWNCYYRAISRFDNRYSKHNKFLHNMRTKHKDSVPPILISGHQFTMISQHQAAAREYLEAYKLMPENPLVNLCAGTALINLALGHRLQNKHQTVLQGLSFLHNNTRLCEGDQESLFNIARAYHHVGLVTLAAVYYEKVLAIRQNDFPIPKLPDENQDTDTKSRGYCDLRREAAYNLHLIYKKSGASDLARQVLKNYVVV